jgi:hypothetical protein
LGRRPHPRACALSCSSLAIYGPGRSNALTSARATLVALQARLRRPHRAGQDGRVRRLRWPIPASGYRRDPSFAGLRPLSWLPRWPTTSKGVCSEQEDDCHGDSRGGDNRAGHCATAVPSLRHQPGLSGSGPQRAPRRRYAVRRMCRPWAPSTVAPEVGWILLPFGSAPASPAALNLSIVPGAAFALAPLKRCAGSSVVRT